MAFERISIDPERMAGVACIRGTRVPVSEVLEMIADGMSPQQIDATLPDVDADDVVEALRYAAAVVRDHGVRWSPERRRSR